VNGTVGAYRVENELGQGGQASVYRALAPDDTPVALKLWYGLGSEPERLRRRIAAEAELVGRIDHPGVVRLLDAAPEHDPPYLAFEYIDGTPLDRWVAQRGPLTGELARQVVVGLLTALSEVHAAPIAHLDVKPHNVVLRPTAGGFTPVLIDFGASRSAEATHTRLTGYSALYASPEQLRMDTAYTPSDIFSWASTSYFLLTGRPPFGGEPTEAMAAVLDLDRLPPREPWDEAVAERAPGLWEILVSCWHREPALRWPLATAPAPGADPRPTCDTHALLGAVEDAFGAQAPVSALRVGRINPLKAGPTPWHELGAQMRHRRRHGVIRLSRRHLVHQRELLGRLGVFRLWAYEYGWLEPPYELVSLIDRITGAEGYLRYLHLCARGSDQLGLDGRPRGQRYPVPGDASELHESTPDVVRLAPWERGVFPLAVRNTGTVTWEGRFLRAMAPVTGTETVPLRGSRLPVPRTGPGETAHIPVAVTAPGWPAVYRQRFKMVDAEDSFCFPGVNTLGVEVMIQVANREQEGSERAAG
jgi:serine/threonine protein kinase